jgi:hypothetical protein
VEQPPLQKMKSVYCLGNTNQLHMRICAWSVLSPIPLGWEGFSLEKDAALSSSSSSGTMYHAFNQKITVNVETAKGRELQEIALFLSFCHKDIVNRAFEALCRQGKVMKYHKNEHMCLLLQDNLIRTEGPDCFQLS